MATPTVPVTVTLAAQDGTPYEGVTVRARLDKNDVYESIVISDQAEGTTDADGVAVLNLFPNAPSPTGLGTQGTTYRFAATISGGRSLNVQARVPNEACRLENILVDSEAVTLSAAELALMQAQSAVTTAATSAAAAEEDAQQTALDRVATGEDREVVEAIAADYGDISEAVAAAETGASTATTQAGIATTQASYASAAAIVAVAARDSVNTSGKVFTAAEGTAAGIAATSDGQQFAVLDASLNFWSIYRNNAGAPLGPLSATYTKAFIDAFAPRGDTSNNLAFGTESQGRFAGGGLVGALDNISIGYQAGGSLIGGDRNTDIGRSAGRANVAGTDNVRIGYAAGLNRTGGVQNVSVGSQAGSNASTAVNKNVAVGALALNNSAVDEAVAVGHGAGTSLTTGVRFSAFGTGAGTSHTTQTSCTFLGWGAGAATGQTYTHNNQTAVGAQSYCNYENQVALGDDSVNELRLFGGVWARQYAFADTIIGDGAGNRDTTAGSGARVIIGYGAGTASLGANDNLSVIIGYLTCNEGSQNRAYVAIGDKAGQYAQNNVDCTFVGSQAGRWLGRHQPLSWNSVDDETHVKAAGADVTQGMALPAYIVGATGVGKNALRYNTIGPNNTAFGDSALGFTTTGQQNVAIGYVCGEGNVTGSFNTMGGQGVHVYQLTGDYNALWGYGIGAGVGSFGTYPAGGSFNAIVGGEAAYDWAGSDVSAVGYRAFYNMTAGTGGDVGVGLNAGRSIVTGGGNTFLGKDAGYNGTQATDVQNSMALGNGTYTTKDDQVVIGNSAVTEVVIAGVTFSKAQLEALLAMV